MERRDTDKINKKQPGTGPFLPGKDDELELVATSLRRRRIARGFENARVLVTGGSGGIGAAIVQRLASEGAHVALTYGRHAAKAEETVQAMQEFGGRTLSIQADLTQADAVRAAVQQAASEFGGLDILVHSAGIGVFGHILELSDEDLDRALSVNMRGTYVAIQEALRHMQAGGRIVIIGSGTADRVPLPGNSLYAMTKSGLIGLVRAVARDIAPSGITINNIQPGPIDTPMNPADSEFAKTICDQFMAIRRYGTGEEVASMVAYVAGKEADFLTGATLTIDGGYAA